MAIKNRDEAELGFAGALDNSVKNATATPTGSSTGTGASAGSSTTEDNKYKTLETTSYKDMLSSKIQANNAKEEALKYSGNALNATGMGDQGMAESTRAGIMNTYGRAIQNADQTHQANMMDIERQKIEDAELAKEDKWQSAMTMLSQATSQEDLDYVKNNFYADMDDNQKKMFDYYYASYTRNFDTGNSEWADRIFSTTELKEEDGTSYVNFNKFLDLLGNAKGLEVSTEGTEDVKNFYMNANNGDLAKITLTNGEQTEVGYAFYYNGKLYKVDADLIKDRPISASLTVTAKKK